MGSFPGGNIVRITPTISATAYDAGDVLFLTTEIPNAVKNRGGVSRLIAITFIAQHDVAEDYNFIFMENQYNLIGALSPGSSGGPAISDANVEAAKITSTLNIDGSAVSVDLGSSRVGTFCQNDVNMAGLNCLVKAAEGSTSVYVAGIAKDAQDYDAVDDLDIVFHFEYLD